MMETFSNRWFRAGLALTAVVVGMLVYSHNNATESTTSVETISTQTTSAVSETTGSDVDIDIDNETTNTETAPSTSSDETTTTE